eukprot:6672205-Pyramimonas_sp.AAC.2
MGPYRADADCDAARDDRGRPDRYPVRGTCLCYVEPSQVPAGGPEALALSSSPPRAARSNDCRTGAGDGGQRAALQLPGAVRPRRAARGRLPRGAPLGPRG